MTPTEPKVLQEVEVRKEIDEKLTSVEVQQHSDREEIPWR